MSKPRAEIEHELRALISETLAPIEYDEIHDTTDLTVGILDSFALVVIFQFIENEIGHPLRDDEMTRDVVRTVVSISQFIERERR